MNIRALKRGFGYSSRNPKKIFLAFLYIYAGVWFVSRDSSNQSSTQKDGLTSANDISIVYRNDFVGTVDNIDVNNTATAKLKHYSAQSVNTMQESEIEPRGHKNITIIKRYKAVQMRTENWVHKCTMDKYIHVTKQQCQSIPSDTSAFKISDGNTKKGLNQLSYRENSIKINSVQNNKARYIGCDIDNVFFNCDELRYSYLYGKESVTEEEELFPLAFAMKIHKSENQAHRLLRYIYQKHNIYCIHIDTKAPAEVYFKFRQIGQCFDNIHVVEDRVNVVYSTIRQVEAEFKCMEAMVKHGHTWKYYINLTGQEFMLRTNLELVKILKLLNGRNDIETYPVPSYEFNKFKQKTIITSKYAIISKKRKIPFSENIEIRKGSAYGMFSRKFVDFILNDTFVKRFYDWLGDAYAPEELIWATLNSMPDTPGGHVGDIKGESFLSRAVKWSMDRTVACGGKYVHYVCVYGTSDIPWLLSHRNVVANKFYEDFQPLALDCVENEMYLRLMSRQPSNLFDLTYYRKVLESTENL